MDELTFSEKSGLTIEKLATKQFPKTILEKLLKELHNVIGNSTAPHFKVASAIIAESGKVYFGVNWQDRFGDTHNQCAEKNGVGSAITAGEHELIACILYLPSDVSRNQTSCGGCRDVLYAHASKKFGKITGAERDLLIVPVYHDGSTSPHLLSEIYGRPARGNGSK
jgi:cytidine deaminase